jgi:hypothetical protein
LLGDPARYFENQIGATLGGPIVKDKTFFFLSYQWDRATSNLSGIYPVIATLPTAAGITALSNSPTSRSITNLLSTPSVTRIPRISAPCFSEIPPAPASGFNTTNPCRAAQNVAVGSQSIPFSTFLVPNSNVFFVQDHQLSGRVDHKINNDNDIYIRYLFDDLTVPRFPLAPAGDSAFSDLGLLPDWQLLTRQRSQSLLVNHRWYGRNELNEFRFAYSRSSLGVGATRIPSSLRGIPSATVVDNFGGFDVFQANFFAAGTRFTIGRDTSPTQTDSNIFQFQENYSLSIPKHNLKFGANFVRIQSNIVNIPTDLGSYFFEASGFSPLNGFAAFATEPGIGNSNAVVAVQRLPNLISDPGGTIRGQGSPNLPLREFDQFYFVQDDWQVRPNLTLSLGLRYENFGQPINRVGELNLRAQNVRTDNNNLAPRFGFAWSMLDRFVVRGGYAMMYNPIVLSIPLLMWQSGPISPLIAGVGPSVSLGGGLTGGARIVGTYPNSPFTPASVQRFVQGCSFPGQRFSPGTVPLIDCSAQDTVDPKLVNPYVQNFSLGIQYEITPSLLWEMGYVGSKGTKLFLRENRNPHLGWNRINVGGVCPVFDPTQANCLLARVNNSRGSIATITNSGSSIYHSLQTSLTRRLRPLGGQLGDATFSVAYTWSHNIDNASEILGPGVRVLARVFGNLNFLQFLQTAGGFEAFEAITPFAQNPNNLHGERGNSAFDRRHRFTFNYLWDIAPRAKSQFVRGWQWSGIVSYQSGQPFNPLNSTPFSNCADFNGDGLLTNDRPAIGNPNAPANRVALLADPRCINPALGYTDLAGNPIDPAQALFVQVPVGLRVGDRFTAGSGTFVAGSAGRNILQGPHTVTWDMSVLKNFYWGETRYFQLRWEVYNLLNRRNPGNPLGNVFTADAQISPAYAFSPGATPARVTGVIPENSLDAFNFSTNENTFLSTIGMNTSSRRMQFSFRFIF